MTTKIARAAVTLGIAALLVPAGAAARQNHGSSAQAGTAPSADTHSPVGPKGRNFIFVGKVAAVDATANIVTVHVNRANHRGRAARGRYVAFDLSNAKLRVADVNGDGKHDVADIAVDDRVLVQARLSRDTDLTAPLPARRLIDPTSCRRARQGAADHPAPNVDDGSTGGDVATDAS